jgi:hypothetical protein
MSGPDKVNRAHESVSGGQQKAEGNARTGGWRQMLRQNLRSSSYGEAQVMLKPAPQGVEHAHVHSHAVEPAAQTQAAPSATVATAFAGEVRVDASGSDVANRALAAMATGTAIEQNTRARIVAGVHKIAYLQDLAVHPDNLDICRRSGVDPSQFTAKINPWNGQTMLVQNNAAGFATGNNIVGSRTASLSFWRTTLLCHEVSHIIHSDGDTAADSFDRYKGEFRAYWVAGFHTVADLADRARQIKEHLLRTYPLMRSKYGTDTAYKRQVDAHLQPDRGDNLDNHQ